MPTASPVIIKPIRIRIEPFIASYLKSIVNLNILIQRCDKNNM
jgi:hypothetical protein